MIKIKCHIYKSNENDIIKNIQFDSSHEKNFATQYNIVNEKIANHHKIDLEELLICCSYLFIKEIRENTNYFDAIITRLKNKIGFDILNNIEQIDFEIIIDSMPKKIIKFYNIQQIYN